MIALIQRVSSASVTVSGHIIGSIDAGVLALIGVEKSDDQKDADRLLERLLGYRIFPDDLGKMNLSLSDINGGLLLVPQFTLVADTRKGMRPSFSSAASPEYGQNLFAYLKNVAEAKHHPVASGQFGADMQVSLTNNGPVTFILQTSAKKNCTQ